MSSQPWYADGLRFTCTQCGNCCTGGPGYVWFTEPEAEAMARHLKITVSQFRKKYTHRISSRWSLAEVKSEHGYDCVFLKRDEAGKALCSIYPVRPGQCKSWPFWPENLQNLNSWRRASERCPGMTHGQSGEGKLYPVEQIRIIRDGAGETTSQR